MRHPCCTRTPHAIVLRRKLHALHGAQSAARPVPRVTDQGRPCARISRRSPRGSARADGRWAKRGGRWDCSAPAEARPSARAVAAADTTAAEASAAALWERRSRSSASASALRDADSSAVSAGTDAAASASAGSAAARGLPSLHDRRLPHDLRPRPHHGPRLAAPLQSARVTAARRRTVTSEPASSGIGKQGRAGGCSYSSATLSPVGSPDAALSRDRCI